MREKFDTYLKKLRNSAFDVVAGPMILVAFGAPALLIIAAAAICFFAVRAIIKISKNKKAGSGE